MDYDVADMNECEDPNGATKLLICMVGFSGCGKTLVFS